MRKIIFCSFGIIFLTYLCGYSQNAGDSGKFVHRQLDNQRHATESTCVRSGPGQEKVVEYSEAPGWNWVTQFGGDGNDIGHDIATDAQGNMFVAGSFSGSVTMGGNSFTSSGHRDLFLAKVSNSGSVEWFKQTVIAQYHICEAVTVATDPGGNIYIAGYFDAPSLTLGATMLPRIGKEDPFIAKFDSNGNVLWAKNMASFFSTLTRPRKLAVDEVGDVYLITAHDVLKYNANGQLQWNQYYSTAYFYDIAAYKSNFYLTGYFTNQVTFGFITLTGLSNYGFPFLAKGDPAGYYFWAEKAESNRTYNRGDAIAIDAHENVYFAGSFRKQLTFGSTVITTSLGDYTPFLAKYNSSGQFLWVQSAKHSTNSYTSQTPTDLCLDNGDDPYIIGTFTDGCSFGTTTLNGTGYYVTGYSNTGTLKWVKTQDFKASDSKINLNGKFCQSGGDDGNILICQSSMELNYEWEVRSSGNSGTAFIQALETDAQGNIYSYGHTAVKTIFTGSATGMFVAKHNANRELLWIKPIMGADNIVGDGDPLFLDAAGNIFLTDTFTDTLGIGQVTLVTGDGSPDRFLAKFDNAGTLQWASQIKGDVVGGTGTIIADHTGNVIVTSPLSGSVNFGPVAMTTWGLDDFFLAKYSVAGNFLWAKQLGGSDLEYSSFISTDANNNIFLAGEFYSRHIDLGGYFLDLNENDGDVILAKFNEDGITQWAIDCGDGDSLLYARYDCWPTAIETDGLGNTYVYGWTGSKNQFGTYLLESPFPNNFFLMKVDQVGQVLWAKIIKEKRYGFHSLQIDLDEEGSCYIGGYFIDTIYFDNNMFVNDGLRDIFVAKYDRQGNYQWCKTAAGATNYGAYAYLNGLSVLNSRSLLTAGRFTYNFNFDSFLLSASGQNGFLALLGDPVGATAELRQPALSVSPNPTDGILYLKTNDHTIPEADITVCNSMGSTILTMLSADARDVVRIDLRGFPAGMYLIKVAAPGFTVTQKIILR